MTDVRRTIAVVGGGAAGAIAAVACARDERLRTTHRVVLVDPAESPGRGTAYSTTDPQHVLNVPASAMSAVAGDDDHFVRWLRHRQPGVRGEEFRQRCEYGDYLTETLARERLADRVGTVRSLATDVILRPDGGVVVEHGHGELRADAAVLALGFAPPQPLDIALRVSDRRRHVRDPWAPDAIPGLLAATDPGDPVVLVGSGLTAVDVALTLTGAGRTVCMVSRHGWLPRPHRVPPSPPAPFTLLPGAEPRTAAQLERLVVDHVATSVAAGHDWRAAIDGLRPVTAALWQALPVGERRALLATSLRRWEVHRHRMAPVVARRVRALLASGRLTVLTGSVRAADLQTSKGTVLVQADDGTQHLAAGGLVNCTGPTCDLGRYPGPLGARLLSSGLARRDPTGVGIEATHTGAVLDASGRANHRLTVLGALRRGALLETTAVPELRQQASTIAALLGKALTTRRDLLTSPR